MQKQEWNKLIYRLETGGYSEKSIAIYGIGAVARNIVEQLKGFNLIGLMDKDLGNIGKQIYGLSVISCEDAIQKVDLVIIASNEVYWNTIFERISFLKDDHGIEIFFLNGETAESSSLKSDISENPYWEKNKDNLKELIDCHEIVSFDVFDTLVARKLARPDDILEIVKMKLEDINDLEFDFIQARREAEEICRKTLGKHFTIDEIYSEIKNIIDCSDSSVLKMKELEIETELEYVVPRKDVLDCYNYCLNQNKEVYIISDIHLTKDIMIKLLEKCGVLGYKELLVSCDIKKSKADASMWEYFSSRTNGKSRLHIGDNSISDIDNAKIYGINGFKVMSGYDLLLLSTVSEIAVNACNVHDSIVLGLVIDRMFNSPFALNRTKGKLVVKSLSDFGYIFFGPLIYTYFMWMISEIKKDGIEEILFLAREGYLLERIYKKIISKLDNENLPKGIYFKTSRRMVSIASIKTEEDIYLNLKNSFSGTKEELLHNRFGLDCSCFQEGDIILSSDKQIRETVYKHKDEIIKNAFSERNEYLKYMSRIDLNGYKKVALCDTGIKGTIQNYLSNLIDLNMVGYYFTAYVGNKNPYGLGKAIKALYPEEGLGESDSSNMLKHHILFESAFASPEGMYIKIDETGEFVNAPLMNNQKLFDEKLRLIDGLESFVFDMMDMIKSPLNSEISKKFIDAIYGVPLSANCTVDERIRNVFFVDDRFGVVSEKKIWD